MLADKPRLLHSALNWGASHEAAQCDCACPDTGFHLANTSASPGSLFYQPHVHAQTLNQDHQLLFNPLHDQGVAVLNLPALEVWRRFVTPQPLSIADDAPGLATQMVAAGLLEPEGALANYCRSAPQTLSVWLHVTNDCNLRCDYCYIRKSTDEMSAEVGQAAVEAVIRSALQNGFRRLKLKFAGGEATLNLKRVLEVQAYARQRAAQAGLAYDATVLSNGVALGERAITELETNGLKVSISLDGIGEFHDAQRQFANGRGSFAWVRRTLDRLAARGIRPFISITLSDRNADGLPEVVRFVLERDLPFNINFFRDNECSAPFADLRLRDDRIIAAMRAAFAAIEARLPERSLLDCLVDRAQFHQPHDKTCSVGEAYLVIDHQGHVAKCQMEIERPVTSIWVDDPLAVVRADRHGVQNLSVEEKEGCRECEWRYWCAGGCPVLTFRATGRYDVKSPYCRIYKAIYPELLRLEGFRLLNSVDIAPQS